MTPALAALLSLLAASPAPPPAPERPGARYLRLFDPKTVVTLEGELTGVARVEHQTMGMTAVELTLKAGGSTYAVHLGPSWFIDNQELSLAAGDKVTLTGSKVTVQGTPTLLATEVRRKDEVLTLRAADGTPAWVAWRRQALTDAARASEAIAALRSRLGARLTEAMSQGGPAAALTVCSTEAQTLTAAVAKERGVELGRTSFRLRSPANAPRPWAAATVEAGRGQKAAAAKPVVLELGERVGVLEPIPLGAMCLTCHGAREALAPEVSAALAKRYPKDAAVGFAEGDLRGYFWAEVPHRRP